MKNLSKLNINYRFNSNKLFTEDDICDFINSCVSLKQLWLDYNIEFTIKTVNTFIERAKCNYKINHNLNVAKFDFRQYLKIKKLELPINFKCNV